MYSQSTLGSTQPGERPASTCSGNKLFTRQHFIMRHTGTQVRSIAQMDSWFRKQVERDIQAIQVIQASRMLKSPPVMENMTDCSRHEYD